MKSDEPTQPKFAWLGRFPPHEAAKLLERFQQAGIPFRMEAKRPLPQPGPTAALDIYVDSERSSEAAKIHDDLFGNGLPDYGSSFFRDRRNV